MTTPPHPHARRLSMRSLIALNAALVFVLFMPETKEEDLASPRRQQGLEKSVAGAAGW
ncbi:MAG: hypothetical protein ACYC3I_10095 [Gemmataceae bacterium]